MANFDDQVMGLTGLTINGSSTAPSQSELTQFLTDGAKEIINQLPSNLKEKCMAITALTGSSGQDLDGFGEVMFVTRETGDSTTIYAPCRKIPSMYGGMASDSSSLMYYGTTTDPVYWVDGTGDASKLYIKPNPTSDSDAKIFHISYPSIAYNESSIANFPDEAEYLVPLYGAIKALQSAIGAKAASLPSDISNLTLPVTPTVPTISAQVVEAFSGAPTYTPPVSPIEESSATWASYWPGELGDADPGAFTLTSLPPVSPSISSQAVAAFSSAPVYTPPIITNATDGSIGYDTDNDLSQLSTAAWTSLDYDFDNENIDFLKWFQVAGDFIQNEEDTELASAQLQKISTFISAYGQAMQNKLNIFNDANVEYQADIQHKIKEADLLDAHEARKLQKYQADLSEYQANISKEVQEYQQKLSRYQLELNNTFQTWQTEEANKQSRHQADLGEYQTNIQNALNIFNKENAIYQADIQENIKEADLLDAHEARKLQKYQAETQVYSAEVNSNVQKFTQDLANYNAKIQKHTVDYQWLQGQYALLKKDYIDGLQMLKGGGVSSQQQGGK